MESAFGVEHGFSKSYVDGVWRPASKLTQSARKAVKQGGHYKKAKGPDPKEKAWQKEYEGSAKAFKEAVDRGAKGVDVGLGQGDAATVRYGGKKGSYRIARSADPSPSGRKRTNRHEMAHAKPKRSAYRLHRQIQGNPRKTMREEARADMAGAGYYKNTAGQAGDTAYAAGARARDAVKSKGANKKFQFSAKDKVDIKRAGGNPSKVAATNKQVQDNFAASVNAVAPHYKLKPSAFDDYSATQNKIRDSRAIKLPGKKWQQ